SRPPHSTTSSRDPTLTSSTRRRRPWQTDTHRPDLRGRPSVAVSLPGEGKGDRTTAHAKRTAGLTATSQVTPP
ncbi:hypothetical protein A2U01_0098669, partial [Trifolium medium]|nr:hypothetical protein [Trifolium medium]